MRKIEARGAVGQPGVFERLEWGSWARGVSINHAFRVGKISKGPVPPSSEQTIAGTFGLERLKTFTRHPLVRNGALILALLTGNTAFIGCPRPDSTPSPTTPASAGERSFQSPLSYQLNLPTGWEVFGKSSRSSQGKPMDILQKGGTTEHGYGTSAITITSEPFNDSIILNDYVKNARNKLWQNGFYTVKATEIRMEMKKGEEGYPVLSYGRYLRNEYGKEELIDQIVNLSRIKVNGQESEVVVVVRAVKDEDGDPYLAPYDTHKINVMFLSNRQAWTISLQLPPFAGAGYLAGTFREFEEVLSSFQTKEELKSPTPVTRSVEKPVEPGWKTFHSVIYPYRINLPSNWTGVSYRLPEGQQGGTDRLEGSLEGYTGEKIPTKVDIIAEPVKPWVTLETYTENLLAQLREAIPLSLLNNPDEGILNISKIIRNSIREVGEQETRFRFSNALVELVNTGVVGQKTQIIGFVTRPEGRWSTKIETTIIAIFLDREQAWRISITSGLGPYDDLLLPFQKMLSSLRLLQ